MKMELTKTEIKKELYKQKPIAEYDYTREDGKHYSTCIVIDGQEEEVTFIIPIEEATFEKEVEAQLLIRWLA